MVLPVGWSGRRDIFFIAHRKVSSGNACKSKHHMKDTSKYARIEEVRISLLAHLNLVLLMSCCCCFKKQLGFLKRANMKIVAEGGLKEEANHMIIHSLHRLN